MQCYVRRLKTMHRYKSDIGHRRCSAENEGAGMAFVDVDD
jgi:hypothetical protein